MPGSHTQDIPLPSGGKVSHDVDFIWDLRRRILRISIPEVLVRPKIVVASEPHVFHDQAIHDPIVLIAGQTKTNIGQRAIRKEMIPLAAAARRLGLRVSHEGVTAKGRADGISLCDQAAGSHLSLGICDVPSQEGDFGFSMGPDEVSRPPNEYFDRLKFVQGRQ